MGSERHEENGVGRGEERNALAYLEVRIASKTQGVPRPSSESVTHVIASVAHRVHRVRRNLVDTIEGEVLVDQVEEVTPVCGVDGDG